MRCALQTSVWATLALLATARVSAAAPAAEPLPRIAEVRALPPLPKAYQDLEGIDAHLAWLQQRLAQPQTVAEIYRLQRMRFLELFGAHRMAEAVEQCHTHPPLREDMSYREYCIQASLPAASEQLPQLVALADEARGQGNLGAAAQILRDVAWRQSQDGDIAGAFENFEAALSLVPVENAELLGEIMVDTATSYIVNGDDGYVRKGIELLRATRDKKLRLLQSATSEDEKSQLKDDVMLTEFNEGIAYLLHLGQAQLALPHFERVAAEPSPYREDATSFAAFTAAELGKVERAKAHLAAANAVRSEATSPTVHQYLSCYRQLAQRHWHAGQSLSACLALKPDTATEVQIDIYRRLSRSEDGAVSLAGLKGLVALFTDKLEPQLRRRGSHAASNVELKRLQRESELKTLVLAQQDELQREREATAAQRQNSFIALFLLLLAVTLLVALQWRSKRKLAQQYERLSLLDSLTGLGNRRFLEQHIGRELALLARTRRNHPQATLGVYLFDVDRFKAINDQHGHATGDAVLKTFARRVQAITRETDLLVRWGGEEFLLVARLERVEHAEQVAARVLQAVNASAFEVDGAAPIPVTCSLGAVCLPFLPTAPRQPWPALVSLADLALYEAKAQGRNRWVLVHNAAVDDADALARLLQAPLQESAAAGRVRLTTG
ncbi:diguanylate cyclase domain-containing protein [Roseateles sp. NT4]|uniref:GGDEF domain-containing protein n=1 Tax=Roseateles sp. NT4 TaxID=3453715 RepID=UPI003EEB4381